MILPLITDGHFCRNPECGRTNVAIEVGSLRCPDCHKEER